MYVVVFVFQLVVLSMLSVWSFICRVLIVAVCWGGCGVGDLKVKS